MDKHPDIERLYAALYGPPMSADEMACFNSLRAKEMARAEARRQPSPQLELPE